MNREQHIVARLCESYLNTRMMWQSSDKRAIKGAVEDFLEREIPIWHGTADLEYTVTSEAPSWDYPGDYEKEISSLDADMDTWTYNVPFFKLRQYVLQELNKQKRMLSDTPESMVDDDQFIRELESIFRQLSGSVTVFIDINDRKDVVEYDGKQRIHLIGQSIRVDLDKFKVDDVVEEYFHDNPDSFPDEDAINRGEPDYYEEGK